MLQTRVKDGDDQRWYNPERDLVHIAVPMLKASIDRLTQKYGEVDKDKYEELCKTATGMGVLVDELQNGVIKTREELFERLAGFNPNTTGDVGWEFLHIFLECYRRWSGDVKKAAEAVAPAVAPEGK